MFSLMSELRLPAVGVFYRSEPTESSPKQYYGLLPEQLVVGVVDTLSKRRVDPLRRNYQPRLSQGVLNLPTGVSSEARISRGRTRFGLRGFHDRLYMRTAHGAERSTYCYKTPTTNIVYFRYL